MTRRSRIDYFDTDDSSFPSLSAEIQRKVRFEEVDSLGIVWHGRYPGYFEEGRDYFGSKYNLKYFDLNNDKFIAPVVKIHIDYIIPLEYEELFTINCTLHWTDAAKLNFSYKLINSHEQIIAAGYTVQIFTDTDKKPLILRPLYIENFFNRWEEHLKI
jgi:acyl-CoA thioester hydrolase